MNAVPEQPATQSGHTPVEFSPFPKLGRLRRAMTITEKLDGTNAAVRLAPVTDAVILDPNLVCLVGEFGLYAQSRNRFVTPENDNYGFARWVLDNAADLVNLGAGVHFGEWWGAGIQRRYGLTEKRFSLFNTSRWNAENPPPPCCSVVPVIYSGPFSSRVVDEEMATLAARGSYAAPGFMNPEGVVVHHSGNGAVFKVTFEHDEAGKGDSR